MQKIVNIVALLLYSSFFKRTEKCKLMSNL